MEPTDILEPEQRLPSKAYLANELRKTVIAWREKDYPNVADTIRRLLQFWFGEDYIVDSEPEER